MPAEIRPARASDLDALVALENAVFRGDRLSRQSFRRLIGSSSATVLVAAGVSGVDGYCAVFFRKHARVARLYSLAARPGAGGTGSRLLAAAERQAGTCAHWLRLEVRSDNDRAIALYKRSGYAVIGEIENYYQDGANALRYEKRLDQINPSAASRAVSLAERPILQ